MKRRKLTATVAAAFGCAVLIAWNAAAQTAEVRVLVSNGVRAVMEQLRPEAERATGRRLAIEFASSSAVKKRIEGGEAFDVAIVTSEVIDALIGSGKIVSASRADVARSGIGIAVRSGAPKPDISSADALKRTFVHAKSITYAADGASRPHLEALFDRFGIAQEVKAKTILAQSSLQSTAKVAQGEAELVITLVSEIVPIQGIDLVGSFPADVQKPVSFAAGVGSKSTDAKAGKALIDFIAGPTVASSFKAKGLEHR
jgi:molybdate transport system substrate-binding protein